MVRLRIRLLCWALAGIGFAVQAPVTGSGQTAGGRPVAGRNINMVSGSTLPNGDPYLQRQDEGSFAVSTRNPMHLLGGANDYRTVDTPGLPDDEETGDAWLGLFKSFDGAQSWQSTLLPGYPQDSSPEGTASPLHGFTAAADPTVRSGPHGLFYYSGIAFDRNQNSSVVFIARYIDLNNKEGVSFDLSTNDDPIKYIDTKILDSGTSGQFLDKPWLAVDIPRGNATLNLAVKDPAAPGGVVNQSGLACGNVYLAYAIFTGDTSKNLRTKVMLARSLDGGTTWQKPVMIDESWHISQGTTVAVDPQNGDVYVAWRQFATSSDFNGIVVAKSTNGGGKFSKAVPVAAIAYPADQPTLPQAGLEDYRAFRTSAFPTMAVDNNHRAYIAWSQRDSSVELGRIYISSSLGGTTWSAPAPIEPMSATQPASLSATTGQFMPALTFGGNKLTMIYYDLRFDLNWNYPSAIIADLRPYDDQEWHPPLMPSGRHTLDVRAAQFMPGQSPPYTSIPVSQYFSVIGDVVKVDPACSDAPGSPCPKKPVWLPVQYNPPNYPLFAQGTSPFIGDYLDIASSQPMVYRNGKWQYNAGEPVDWHAVWTDNRDVVTPDAPYDWTAYVPPGQGDSCSTAGMRNQNIYTSRLTEGMAVGTMGNSKNLYSGEDSTFVVFVQNLTNETRSYHLAVAQPANGTAVFAGSGGSAELDLTGVLPYEGLVRTVVARSSSPRASMTVTVTDTTAPGGQVRSIALNPDPLNPPLLSVENGVETHNPYFEKQPNGSTTQIVTWPPLLIQDAGEYKLNPAYLNPEMLNPEMLNPEMLNPEMLNPEMLNPEMLNPEMLNPEMLNPEMLNPEMLNPEMLNPEMLNPEMLNPEMLNAPITDINWTVKNGGNVDSGFKFAPLGKLPAGIKSQLIIYRSYKTPFCNSSGGSSRLDAEGNNFDILANISNPDLGDPTTLQDNAALQQIVSDAIAYKAGSDEKIYIKLRVWNPDYKIENYAPGPWNSNTNPLNVGAGAVVVAQSPNADGSLAWASTPIITLQPVQPGPACVGEVVSLNVAAVGNPVPLIQWQESADGGATWNPVTGATATSLSITADAARDGYRYRAVFTNENGTAVSGAVVLTVNRPVVIMESPSSQTTCLGESVTFQVQAAGTPPSGQGALEYQWRRNGVDIDGANGASLTIPSAAPADEGTYDVQVSGWCGFETSGAAVLTVNSPPSIAIQPGDATVITGAYATFTAQAAGTPAPAVQWQESVDGGSVWTDIPGATSASYSAAAALFMSGYRYRAVFTNSCGSATSGAAVLAVRYNFIGFSTPLGPAGDPAPTMVYGPFNSQSNVTVKWQLLDGSGGFISDLAAVTAMTAEGPGGVVTLYDPSQNTTGNTVLRYSSSGNQFVFNWDVTLTPAGNYTLDLSLADGSHWKVRVQTQ